MRWRRYSTSTWWITGVKLALGERVERFGERDGGVAVVTDKRTVPADIVILAIGVKPNSGLAKDCGLKLNARGGIVVDEFLKTSDENIYAVGDAVETENFITHDRAMIPLAGPANKMGRMAADNICGMNRRYKGTQGASVAKVFDMAVASTGLNERQLIAAGKKLNEDYKVTLIHPLSHAGYYPGGLPLSLKLLFAKEDGKVLGVQAVGYKGVEKRVDVVATAIKFGATVYDLEELELCYAPPYSSAKDPVNMAGYLRRRTCWKAPWTTSPYGELSRICRQGYGASSTCAPHAEVSDGRHTGQRATSRWTACEAQLDTLDKEQVLRGLLRGGHTRVHRVPHTDCRTALNNVRNLAGGYTTYRVASQDYSAPTDTAGQ